MPELGREMADKRGAHTKSRGKMAGCSIYKGAERLEEKISKIAPDQQTPPQVVQFLQ
jgi:hypothetical protein